MRRRINELITDKISGEWGNEGTAETGVKVIRTANFTNSGMINFHNLVYRQIDPSKVAAKRLKHGDILIEKSGGSPKQPVGRVVFFDKDTEESFLSNNFTSVLRPNKDLVYPKFLFYSLFEGHKKGKTLRYQNKTTGIINLKLDNYLQESIYVPDSIEDQIRIANILSKAESLISQRKESLHFLDELLKSTFLEMFGDPMKNEMGWEKKRLGAGAKVQGGFAFKGEDISNTKTDLRLVKISNVNFESLDWKEVSYLPDEHRVKYNDFELKENDLLIALTRPIIKSLDSVKCASVRGSDVPSMLNQRVARFLCNPELLDRRFLKQFIYTRHFANEIVKFSATSLQPNVSTSQIESIPMYFPPIELQAIFGKVMDKSEALKTLSHSSLMELENLYGSLSQSAFRGELEVNKLPLVGSFDPINVKTEPKGSLAPTKDESVTKVIQKNYPNGSKPISGNEINFNELLQVPKGPKEVASYNLYQLIIDRIKEPYFTFEDLALIAKDGLYRHQFDKLKDIVFDLLRSNWLKQVFTDATFKANLDQSDPNFEKLDKLPERMHFCRVNK